MDSNLFATANGGRLPAGRQDVLRSVTRMAAIAAAILLLTILAVTRSSAAFSATTVNTANAFGTSGTVVLTDDDGGSAMFTAPAMTPGTSVVECITVTYSGTLLNADIRMYGSTTGGLDTYLDMTIETGTGDCTTFTSTGTIFNDTLENFGTTHTGWTNGLAVYTATVNPQPQLLRFTMDVQDVAAAQNNSTSAAFTWEAQDV